MNVERKEKRQSACEKEKTATGLTSCDRGIKYLQYIKTPHRNGVVEPDA
jgi:hypothetical protein